MSLDPFLSLSALTPIANTYDPANPAAPHAFGFVYSFGGYTYPNPGLALRDQYNNNEIIMGWDAVPPGSTPYSSTDNPYRHCTVAFVFQGNNVTSENQYLIMFGLRAVSGAPQVEFILGSQIYDTELITGDEQHAILIDCPGDEVWTMVLMRVASANYADQLAFKGVDCYVF